MKTYIEYLIESDREYSFRIKSIIPMDEDFILKLEKVLQRYELRDLRGPSKTIIQHTPLDFEKEKNCEVYIVDVSLGVPVTSFVLTQEIRSCVGVLENQFVVRGDNDPLEVETQKINLKNEINSEIEEKDLKKASLLDTRPEDPLIDMDRDNSKYYGNSSNSSFLQLLARISATRKEGIVQAKSPLFDFLRNDVQELGDTLDNSDFNKELLDKDIIVNSVPWWKIEEKEIGFDGRIAPTGNFDEDSIEKSKEAISDVKDKKIIIKKSNKVRK